MRTETGISKGTTSFAYAAVTVARGEDQAGLRGARVVVVGAGDMGLGVCRALSDIAPADAPQRVVVVNRSAARARDLVRQAATGPFEMRAAPLQDVAGELADARRRPDRRGRRVARAGARPTSPGSPARCW